MRLGLRGLWLAASPAATGGFECPRLVPRRQVARLEAGGVGAGAGAGVGVGEEDPKSSSPWSSRSAPGRRAHFIRDIVEKDLARGAIAKVVTRFPPEPNGYLHVGHAKAICLNFGLARDYGGDVHLRLDDTNPTKEDERYAAAIEEDVRWLAPVPWTGDVRHASDYFEAMYDLALALVEAGEAYVDSQPAEEMRRTRGTLQTPGVDSPYRNRTVDENRDLFLAMRRGDLDDGTAVLRAKIDMASPNLNLRDPTLYRIIKATPHPRTGDAWPVYPMYDFAHAVSDAVEGVTHSLCTLEFQDHRPLYDWVVDRYLRYLSNKGRRRRRNDDGGDGSGDDDDRGDDGDDDGSESSSSSSGSSSSGSSSGSSMTRYPRQIEFSRLNLRQTVTSKRKLAKLVASGAVDGWTDPRMPTISAMRRRGVPAAAVDLFCERIGISKADSKLDPAIFDDCVREVLEASAPRAFAVLDPLRVELVDFPAEDRFDDVPRRALGSSQRAVVGGQSDDGPARSLRFGGGKAHYVDRSDFWDVETRGPPPPGWKRLVPGGKVRLRYAYVVECLSVERDPETGEVAKVACAVDVATRAGKKVAGLSNKKQPGIIHWLREDDAAAVEVRTYDRLFKAADPGDDDDVDPASKAVFRKALVERGLLLDRENDAPPPPPGKELKEDTFQFERLGYFRREDDGDATVFHRVVPLKDSFGAAGSDHPPKATKAATTKAEAERPNKKATGWGKGEADPTRDLAPAVASAARLEVLVGDVVDARPHDDADDLLCLSVDLGEGAPRPVAAKLRRAYPDDQRRPLPGRLCVLANTKPRSVANFESRGVVLCAASDDGATVVALEPPRDAPVGARLTLQGCADVDAAPPSQVKNKRLWERAQPDFRLRDGVLYFQDRPVGLDDGARPCTAAGLADGRIQ